MYLYQGKFGLNVVKNINIITSLPNLPARVIVILSMVSVRKA